MKEKVKIEEFNNFYAISYKEYYALVGKSQFALQRAFNEIIEKYFK